ncbi:hypothetical protein B0T25DRAFT_485703 [Lasiosphaeria hispida]|uniref:Major facilitator superfamily transporter n=1 Tax=Lasiosphaeria hispida TaxID=260671 RepID=A0AAJ0M8X1_9PEZI|nr:hypothetical protein B0T25DRAFT_485703 [Lasiosphaeria hispida]
MVAEETTPLLSDGANGGSGIGNNGQPEARRSKLRGLGITLRQAFHAENRILLAGFLITLAFSFTQVPIFYVFYMMECDVYYATHPPFAGPPGDRCMPSEITARTSTDFAVLAMSTTFCGTLNLFVAGWTVKKVGPRLALMVQTFVPAIRVATQILGVVAGGTAGIAIFQYTQLITIIGGPAGYILVINIIAGEIVTPVRRTVVFGMLQGCIMLGQGVGYLTGGIIGDAFGIRRPFETAFFSFLLATLYVEFALPYISPESMSNGKPEVKGLAAFFAPLKVIAPQKFQLQSGKIIKHYGVVFLCLGVFFAVLATDYAPLLIQMYATAVFQFTQGDNGLLMSGFACMRAVFLIFLFPRIITHGRTWYLSRHPTSQPPSSPPAPPIPAHLPTRPEELEAPIGTLAEQEPTPSPPSSSDAGTAFDLFFLRWSLVVDGAMTMLAALATRKWHIYLAAYLLPLASGSAPAAKGVMTEMCAPEMRADALNALTLVENIARLATQGLFGLVFAALAGVGKPHLTFFCNAAIAMLAALVLVFSHFAPKGSRRVTDEVSEEGGGHGEGEGEGLLASNVVVGKDIVGQERR